MTGFEGEKAEAECRDDRYWQILLQKSAASDGLSAITLSAAGFDPPAPTFSTQLLRYAKHKA
jgi:hypothetical protein